MQHGPGVEANELTETFSVPAGGDACRTFVYLDAGKPVKSFEKVKRATSQEHIEACVSPYVPLLHGEGKWTVLMTAN